MSVDKLSKLEEEFSDAAGELSTWRDLQDHIGWKKLMAIAEGQVSSRAMNILRSPLKTLDGALEQEFSKGEGAGIELFRNLPQIEINQLEAKQLDLEREIEHERAITENAAKTGSGGTGRDDSAGSSPEPGLLDDDRDSFGRNN